MIREMQIPGPLETVVKRDATRSERPRLVFARLSQAPLHFEARRAVRKRAVSPTPGR
jgi:hypothetical protein